MYDDFFEPDESFNSDLRRANFYKRPVWGHCYDPYYEEDNYDDDRYEEPKQLDEEDVAFWEDVYEHEHD